MGLVWQSAMARYEGGKVSEGPERMAFLGGSACFKIETDELGIDKE